MTNCALMFWIVGGIFGGGILIVCLSFLFKKMFDKISNKRNNGGFPSMSFNFPRIEGKSLEFPKMEFKLPRFDKIPQLAYGIIIFAVIVIGYVKYIPWGNIKPCSKSKTTEQSFFQKPPADSTGHYIYHN